MRKFIFKLLIILSPIVIAIVILIFTDAYKVLWNYKDYYKNSFIELNREMVCLRMYDNHRKEEKFDSFIFGSSRSQAFHCEEWSKYLDENAKPFHFDAHGEGIYGIAKKIEYIDKLGDNIKNAIIVVDRTILSVNKNRREKHLSISPPELSGESKVHYYYTFIKGQLNYKFLLSYFDYSIFRTYRDYMEGIVLNNKYPYINNSNNCDIWYGNEEEIKNDSLNYYFSLKQKGVFYDRPLNNYKKCTITELEVEQLKSIKHIFSLHKTEYKIIISPNYDQIILEKEQVELLENVFGKENIYNYSGKNRLTESIGNYYEDSHYRPNIANEILRDIYNQ